MFQSDGQIGRKKKTAEELEAEGKGGDNGPGENTTVL